MVLVFVGLLLGSVGGMVWLLRRIRKKNKKDYPY